MAQPSQSADIFQNKILWFFRVSENHCICVSDTNKYETIRKMYGLTYILKIKLKKSTENRTEHNNDDVRFKVQLSKTTVPCA